MRIVDANVLLYAVNADSRHHDASRRWLDAAVGGGDRVGFSWIVSLAFLRLATSARIFPNPLAPETAVDQLGRWTEAPGAVFVHPSAAHLAVFGGLVVASGSAGNLVNDAHLAALAVEHRADVVSYDNDFERFEGVRRVQPDALLS